MEIAICVIAYNRINSLKRLLNSLTNAFYDENEVPLIISIDKSDCTDVSGYANSFEWSHGVKRVILQNERLGLRNHVLKCGDLLDDYDALIVLEDDVSVAQSFYFYAKQCAEKYKDDDKIAGISLFNFPLNHHNLLPFQPLHSNSDVYLMQYAQSWGEVWMKKQWKEFTNWYDKHDEEFGELPHLPRSVCSWPRTSWLKYHIKYCVECNKYFVYPYISLSTNNADVGVHYAQKSSLFQTPMLYGKKEVFNLNPEIKYDVFYENENLYDWLSLNRNELCIDLYGEKRNLTSLRYWLSMKTLPYKIVKSWGLSQRPFEWNILNNVEGDNIYLYDTFMASDKPKRTFRTACNIVKYIYDMPGLGKFIVRQIVRNKDENYPLITCYKSIKKFLS